MARWIVLVSLVAISLTVGGYLFAVLVPREANEVEAPIPILVTSVTITTEP